MDRTELLSRFHLDAEEAVLLIIDVQTKLMAAMPDAQRLCRNTGILLTAAQALNIPVVVSPGPGTHRAGAGPAAAPGRPQAGEVLL